MCHCGRVSEQAAPVDGRTGADRQQFRADKLHRGLVWRVQERAVQRGRWQDVIPAHRRGIRQPFRGDTRHALAPGVAGHL